MSNGFKSKQDLIVISAIFGYAAVIQSQLNKVIFRPPTGTWEVQEGMFSLADCFIGYPPHGGARKKRLLAFTPDPESFLLYTANGEDGWSSLAYILSNELRSKALILGFCRDDVAYPARSFSLLEHGKLVRHVSARLEDKWIFYEQGTPLPQEDVSNYSKRLIKERLTNADLIRLARHFGVNLEDLTQVSGKGVLYVQT